MSKDGAEIHYLNQAPSARPEAMEPRWEASFEALVSRLEKRLQNIEIEFKKSRDQQQPASVNTDELTSLIRSLESRLEEVADEIHARHPASGTDGSPLLAAIHRMKKIVTMKIFRNFLKTLWFGSREESYEFDEFGMDPAFARRVKPLFDFLFYNYWRVTVKGVENIPSKERGLIVPNHSGTLPYDGAMIRVAVENEHPSRRDVRFLVEDFVYHFPFLGNFMYRIGGVRACPENADRLLSKGHLVTVFPEGVKGIGKHYKNRYRLQRFGRGGFIKLALKTGSPVIPTAVIGAEEIHPLIYKSTVLARPLGIPYIPITPTLPWLGLLGLIPLPSKWTIIFGEPIRFSPKYGPKDAEDQLLVNRLSEMVRGRIQEMIVEAMKHRRSVWFG